MPPALLRILITWPSAPPPGWALLPAESSRRRGFLYAGPTPSVPQWIIDPHVPVGASRTIEQAATAAGDFFGREGVPTGGVSPLWALSLLPPDEEQAFVADVAGNAVVNVQVRPDISDAQYEDLAFLVAHEVFHLHARSLWNDEALARWESEGAAEYAAIRFFMSTGREEGAKRRLERHLNDCLNNVPAGGLNSPGAEGVRYSCGAVYAWILDASRARGAFFPVIRQRFGRLGAPPPPASIAFEKALGAVLNGTPDRAVLVQAALAEGGWRVSVEDPGRSTFGMAAIAPLVSAICHNVDGVSEESDGRWVVHSDSGCGGSGAETEVLAIDERSTRGAGAELLIYLVEHCTVGVTVQLRSSTGRRIVPYRCEEPPQTPRRFYALTKIHLDESKFK